VGVTARRFSPSETYQAPLPDEIGRTLTTLPDPSMTDNICLLRFTSMRAAAAKLNASIVSADFVAANSPVSGRFEEV
jgi:hypothetical protein